MSKNPLSPAAMGLPRYLDTLAKIKNSDKDYAWFDAQAAILEAGESTKKEMYQAMGITPTTLDKYLLIRNLERVRRDGSKETTHA